MPNVFHKPWLVPRLKTKIVITEGFGVFFFFFLGQLELFECGLYARWCLLNCSNVVFPRCGNSVVVMWKRVLVWRTGMLRYLGMKHQCLQLTFRWSGKNEKGMYKYRASQSLNGKESTCQCRRHRFDPWVEKIPGEGNGNLGNPMDRGAWWATIHGVTKEVDMI